MRAIAGEPSRRSSLDEIPGHCPTSKAPSNAAREMAGAENKEMAVDGPTPDDASSLDGTEGGYGW